MAQVIYTVAPNADGIQTANVPIVAANKAYQLPRMVIPDGMKLLIKSLPGNGGYIYVAGNEPESTDPTKAWPLQPGEFIAFAVKTADSVYVSGTVAGDNVVLCAERNESPYTVVPYTVIPIPHP